MAEEMAVTRVATLEKFLKAEGEKKYRTEAVEVLLEELGAITREIDRMAEEEAGGEDRKTVMSEDMVQAIGRFRGTARLSPEKISQAVDKLSILELSQLAKFLRALLGDTRS